METYAGHFYAEAQDSGCSTGPVLPGLYRDELAEGARRTLGEGTYGIWDEDAYQLFMDVETLSSLLKTLDEDSLRAARVAEALEQLIVAAMETGTEEDSCYASVPRSLRGMCAEVCMRPYWKGDRSKYDL